MAIVRRITVEDKATMGGLYKAGWDYKRIGRELGVTGETVRYHILKMGIYDTSRGKVSESEKEETIRLYQSNIPLKDIADRYGVIPWTIFNRLRQWGVPRIGNVRRRHSNRLNISDAQIVAKYRELGSVTATSEFYGWSMPTMRSALDRCGVPHVDDEIAARIESKRPLIMQRLDEGCTGGAIAEEIGIGDSTLGLWFKRNGIKLKRRATVNTSAEHKLGQILQEMGIPYTQQFPIGRKRYDFWLPYQWLLIDAQGDYWHGNPTIYPEDKLNSTHRPRG